MGSIPGGSDNFEPTSALVIVVASIPAEHLRDAFTDCGWIEVAAAARGSAGYLYSQALAVASADRKQRAKIVAVKSSVTKYAHDIFSDDAPVCDHDFAAGICVCIPVENLGACDHHLAAAISQATQHGAMFAIIDYAKSLTWRDASVQTVTHQPSTFSFLFSPCCFGHAIEGSMKVSTNMPYLYEMSLRCRHIHLYSQIQTVAQSDARGQMQHAMACSDGALSAIALAIAILVTWSICEVVHAHPAIRATIAGDECGVRWHAFGRIQNEIHTVQRQTIIDTLASKQLYSRVQVSRFWVPAMAAISAVASIPSLVAVRWPQETIEKSVKKMFPPEWVQSVRFPYVEAILNVDSFVRFDQWLQSRGGAFSQQPPSFAPRDAKGAPWRHR